MSILCQRKIASSGAILTLMCPFEFFDNFICSFDSNTHIIVLVLF